MAAKHKDTRYRVIYAKNYQIESRSDNVMRDFEIYHQDTLLRSNIDYLTDDLMAIHKYTFTLLDKQDIDIFHTMLSNNCRRNVNDASGMAGILRNMTTMSKNHRKNIYIRCLPPMLAVSPESYRVFAEDVLDVVPLMLKRQHQKLSAKHMRILNVKNGEWRKKDDDKSLDLTLSLEQMNEFLEKFDCDKSLLTLVEDPMYTSTRMDQETHWGYSMTCAPDLTQIIDPLQAAAFFFHSVVNGVDWSRKEPCLEHGPECLKTLKERFLGILNGYALTNAGYYLSWTKTLEDCAKVRKDSCFLKYHARRITPDYALIAFQPSHKFPISHFYQTGVYYNLLDETDRFPGHVTHLHVWTLRFLLQLGWVQQFFGTEHKPIRDLIANSALFLVPVEDRKEIEGMMLKMFRDGNGQTLELKYFEPLGLREDPNDEPQKPFQPLQLTAPPGFFEKHSILTNKVVRYQKIIEEPVAPRVPSYNKMLSSLESELPKLIESLYKSLEIAENGSAPPDHVILIQKKIMSMESLLFSINEKVEKGREPTKSEMSKLQSILVEIPELHKKLLAKESEETKPPQKIATVRMPENSSTTSEGSSSLSILPPPPGLQQNLSSLELGLPSVIEKTQITGNGSTVVPEDLLLMDKKVSSLEFVMSCVMEKIEKGEEITPEYAESLSILADLPGLHQPSPGVDKNLVCEESTPPGMLAEPPGLTKKAVGPLVDSLSLDTDTPQEKATVGMPHNASTNIEKGENCSTSSVVSGSLSILLPPPGLPKKLSSPCDRNLISGTEKCESVGIILELPGTNQKSEIVGVAEIAAGNSSTSSEASTPTVVLENPKLDVTVEKSGEPEKAENGYKLSEISAPPLGLDKKPVSKKIAMAQNASTHNQKAGNSSRNSEASGSLSILPPPPGLPQKLSSGPPPGLEPAEIKFELPGMNTKLSSYESTPPGILTKLPRPNQKSEMTRVAEIAAGISSTSSQVPTLPDVPDEPPEKTENESTSSKVPPGLHKKLLSEESTFERQSATTSILAKPPGLHKKLSSEMSEIPIETPSLEKKNASTETQTAIPVVLEGRLNAKLELLEMEEELETSSSEISAPPFFKAKLFCIVEQPEAKDGSVSFEEPESLRTNPGRKTKTQPVKIPWEASNGKLINLYTPQAKPKKTKVIILEKKTRNTVKFDKEFVSFHPEVVAKPLFLIRNLKTVLKRMKEEESQMPSTSTVPEAVPSRNQDPLEEQPAPLPKITVAQVIKLWDYVWLISNQCEEENMKIVKIVADYNEAQFPVLEESQLEATVTKLSKDLSNLQMERDNNLAKKKILLARQEQLLKLNSTLQRAEGDMKEKIQRIVDEHDSQTEKNGPETRKLMEEKDVIISQLKQTNKALSAQNGGLDATIRELTGKIREMRR
ncbi:hypothetical protein GCK72_011718 [Caenorhabditis remanei]|uniref:Uncharacterized protein n=1 Tax=Caenorhabditis remanei TaxID=31234 RepID=A0A6A5HAR0_CAERE|nr:hypothetical protein GCK72_011718 [Caenorhabditis remanei]KAF1763452.1 hypothetical protein GCK72_011718 [Caenorhabditis remanei]